MPNQSVQALSATMNHYLGWNNVLQSAWAESYDEVTCFITLLQKPILNESNFFREATYYLKVCYC